MNEKREIDDRLDRIETDIFLIKEMNIMANEDLFIEKIKKSLGKAKNKYQILLSLYSQPKTQTELCDELNIDKGNLSRLVKDLIDQKMIYPTEIAKSKLIQPTFKIRKNKLRNLISEIFESEPDFITEMETKYL
ncbi:MAG TPA: helix-turn-helix domain-containing protein [Candidatus Bathyarchaeia archaeon]|nr:helix-turn-helix domain-containing protein [Candidatus Bathyarchaeia archaeon]